MFIWKVEECLSLELFIKDAESPASTTSEHFGLGERIDDFAISSEGSSNTNEDKEEEAQSRLSDD